MGPGYADLIGPSTVTPSTQNIPGQYPPPAWEGFGKVAMPPSIGITGITMTTPSTVLPGPSYIQPPGPLAPSLHLQ